MTSAMSTELFPKMKILLFLREADEQMKHLELLLTNFLDLDPYEISGMSGNMSRRKR